MSNKYDDLWWRIDNEGLGYGIQHGFNIDFDDELSKKWNKCRDLLFEIENYIASRMEEDEDI